MMGEWYVLLGCTKCVWLSISLVDVLAFVTKRFFRVAIML